MRIAHITATFPPYYGGTGTVCYENALGLAQLGHQVTVFTTQYPQNECEVSKEFTVCRLPALFRLGNVPLLPGLLGIEGFDILHLHYPFYLGAEMVFFNSLLRGHPYIVTYHQDVLLAGILRYPVQLHHWLVGRRILFAADKVLATSNDYARASRLKELLRRCPEKVGELPNGVDVQRFHPGLDDHNLRARYGLRQSKRIVMFVGGLDRAHYFKGVDVLLQAVAQIAECDLHLIVVGDGDLRLRYQKQATALGLADRVTFCGRVTDEELPAHYALCDLLVLPSVTMGEAFGVVLLEAMACGKPVVASRLPGVRSVVSDGVDGLLVTPADPVDLAEKIQSMFQEPVRLREMGAKGRLKVERKYAWPGIVSGLEKLYQTILLDNPG